MSEPLAVGYERRRESGRGATRLLRVVNERNGLRPELSDGCPSGNIGEEVFKYERAIKLGEALGDGTL